MLFRIVRRSPWIAAGAAGMYLLDPAHGPQRRAELGERARTAFHDLRRSLTAPGPTGPDTTIVDIEVGVEPSRTETGTEVDAGADAAPTGIREDPWAGTSTLQSSAAR